MTGFKTALQRKCPKCGELYYFWLFGRTPCKCRLQEMQKFKAWPDKKE